MEPPRKKTGRRKERVQDSSFMDTVRDAFVRWVALEKWREVEDLQKTVGLTLAQALDEAGHFPTRGRYQHLWVARWRAEVRPEEKGSDAGNVYAAIEKAVATALREEQAERKVTGDRQLEEDPEYKSFVDMALERLLAEEAGTLGMGR